MIITVIQSNYLDTYCFAVGPLPGSVSEEVGASNIQIAALLSVLKVSVKHELRVTILMDTC